MTSMSERVNKALHCLLHIMVSELMVTYCQQLPPTLGAGRGP